MNKFKVHSKFKPAGDQPDAIKKLVNGLKNNYRDQTLLGVTGSGKTFTMAKVIEAAQKPTLIMSHNKTLAAQLYSEFSQFFPDNAVHYFVSYYDYYQPEAYIPQSDTYIEKEATINEEIDRLRHASTQSLITRRDVIIVASVSCIYGIGEKEEYKNMGRTFSAGDKIKRNELLRRLIKIQYERNDTDFYRGQFKVNGDIIDIHLATGEAVVRIMMFGDEIDKIIYHRIRAKSKQPVWAADLKNAHATLLEEIFILPAKHFMTPDDKMQVALANIRTELKQRLDELVKQKKNVEAYRLERKANYDLEMIEQVGYCNGIENYSRHLTGRTPGEPPATLIDFFPKDYLLFIDESHVSLPQIRGMYAGDQSRKQTLVDFGFRLPSAKDNRPLNFTEFNTKINQIIYVSATPSPYEFNQSVTTRPFKENVVMIHGSSGRNKVSDSNYVAANRRHWHGWLEDELTKASVEIYNPIMPNDWAPDYKDWAKLMRKLPINKDTILIGTSAGGPFILKWLLENKKKVKKIILNAPAYHITKRYGRFEKFCEFPLDKNLKELADEFTIFISNDAKCFTRSASEYAAATKAKLIKIKNRGHFCIDDNLKNFQFPELLEEILSSITKEKRRQSTVAEQIIRPTGLLDPEVEIRPSTGQIPDLIPEIEKTTAKKQRVLVTTLTKRMAEELSEYLAEKRMKVQYLHSEIDTLERVEILRDLRAGKYDILVGINLLREGLDLPEVSLVAILDADMSGFLRNETSLMQTMGRASRHKQGRVIMYGDKITPAMRYALNETKRRRRQQEAYNRKHGIKPKTIIAKVHESII